MSNLGLIPAKACQRLGQFLCRFRYPVSLPQDVADVFGVSVSNFIPFDQFLKLVTDPNAKPTRLAHMMPREQAERVFVNAVRKERFHSKTLYSYCFPSGWLEFALHFDDQQRLRRLFVQHRAIVTDAGVEITLRGRSSSACKRAIVGSSAA